MNIEQERFEAWLMAQPDEKEFNYSDNHGCLVCMFLKDTIKGAIPLVGGQSYQVVKFESPDLPLPDFVFKPLDEGRTEYVINCGVPHASNYRFKEIKEAYRKMFPENSVSIEYRKESQAV